MEQGPNYSIYELAKSAKTILALIDKFHFSFFVDRDVPYSRREILCSIQVGGNIKSIDNKVPLTAHPGIHKAVIEIKFYEEIEVKNDIEENKFITHILYNNLVWVIISIINIISDIYEKAIETKIEDVEYKEAIKILTKERQSDKYNNTHPKEFITRYRIYLNKRIKDLQELIELDKLDFGVELKEIIESYKLGLEVNVKGRNLLTPLLARDYKVFIENIKNSLFIPSYHDTDKKEKEKYFHIYLLGVLEGRLNMYNIKSNKESGFGRYDICAFPINKKNPGVIIEIKSDNKSVDNALIQIITNKYENDLKIEGVKEIIAIAINFQSKDIITDYQIIKLD